MVDSAHDARWLVVGAGGMLGRDLVSLLADRDVVGLTRDDLDIASWEAVAERVTDIDVVVNAAAWTKVDDAESQEGDAFLANALGAANLARACASTGARLVQISTDYVFGGDASAPYPEDAVLAPSSAYGRTKAAGEWAVRAYNGQRTCIVRTAWLYGEHGPSFVRTMRRLADQGGEVSVVDDQLGQPTWSRDLARQVVGLVDAGVVSGVFHGTSSGQATWFDLARLVFELDGHDPARVRPTTSAEFTRPAPRPAYSVLGHDAWAGVGLEPMRGWDLALREAWPTLPRA